MNYRIVPVCGRLEVYINGKFFCLADTFHKAVQEIENFFK